MRELNLCYGCMEPLEDGVTVCPHCKYDQKTPCLANYLKPGTVLHERYLIGKALESNGEGVTYIAYDINTDCKVLVREYLPEQLCSRVPESTLVNVAYDHLAQYKALMAEYTELNKALARLRSLSHLNPALDLVSENNTTYAIYEYLEGRTLLQYLKENAGELSWNTVKRIFPPLFTSLSLLHNAGVLHRGLSPETIFVTEKGELKLTRFCISAVRTNDTELDAQLFDGYAAPEQYFADRQQGTWTDVYGICAVLYRILTGCRASDAISRQDYENLTPPAEVNPHIPEKVSDAIMKGMALDWNQRVHTITDLVTLLFEESAEETQPAKPADPPRREEATTVFTAPQPEPQKPVQQKQSNVQPVRKTSAAGSRARTQAAEPSVMERLRGPLLIAFLLLAIVVLVIFAFSKIFNTRKPDPLSSGAEWSSEEDNVVPAQNTTTSTVHYNSIMPNLVGMNFPIKQQEMAGWLELDPEYIYDENIKKDQIIWQELPEGAEFLSGSTVKVRVSRGSSKIEIPSFSGYTLETYLAELEELGFVPAHEVVVTTAPRNTWRRQQTTETTTTTAVSTYTAQNGSPQSVIYQGTVNWNFANGNVCSVSPDPGTKIDVLKGYEIVIYYANNPTQTSARWTTTSTSGTTGSTTTTAKAATTTSAAATTKDEPASTSAPDVTTAAPPPASTEPPPVSTEAPPPPPPVTTAAPDPAAE